MKLLKRSGILPTGLSAHGRENRAWNLVAVLAATMVSIAQAQVTEDWVVHYGSGGDDRVADMDIDGNGAVYVTGQTELADTDSNITTVKYDSDGQEIWVRHFDNGSSDWANRLTVDKDGNVQVTGSSSNVSTGNRDYVTVKYDTSGVELWVRFYDNGGNDSAQAIAADADGNIYVAGNSDDPLTGSDFVTVKYDAAGNRLWDRRYDHIGKRESAEVLAVDDDGNVYVSGASVNENDNSDFATVKYDPIGKQLWVRRYDSAAGDSPVDMALDEEGNIYVTGYGGLTVDTFGNGVYTTIKYSSNGEEIWVRQYAGGGTLEDMYDEARAIAIDGREHVFVAGANDVSIRGYASSYDIVAYDLDGNELWTRRFDENETYLPESLSLATDASGSAYISASSQDSDRNEDILAAKYDADGNEIWVVRYDETSNDRAKGIAVSGQGEVYVSGTTYGVTANFVTIGYSQTDTPDDEEADSGDRQGGGGGSLGPITVFALIAGLLVLRKKEITS